MIKYLYWRDGQRYRLVFYLTLDVKKFNASYKKNRNTMFNFQISKEKADNDGNVIRPVKNSKIGGRWGMDNKILEPNSNKKNREKDCICTRR